MRMWRWALLLALALPVCGGCEALHWPWEAGGGASPPGGTSVATGGASASVESGGELLDALRRGVRMRRLDNGLVLITRENHVAPVVSVYVVVRAGSLLEKEFMGSGISHLTEHLVSGGSTATRSEDQIEDTLADIGALTNAYTSMDRTAYFINTIPEHLDTAVDLLADCIRNSKIEQKEFDREFGVVQREILTGEGEPRRQAAELLGDTMFADMPQGVRVIGYYGNIQKLTRDDVWTYYRRMYVPSNAVVCVAGQFDGAAVMDMLEKAFGDWQGPHAPPAVLPEPVPPVSDLVAVRQMDTQLAHVHVAWHSCRLNDPDLYALDVLAGVLGGGESSRLAADLKSRRSLVYGISAWNYTPTWPGGEFAVSFTCDPDKVDAVRAAVAGHVARLCREAPTAEEVEKIKRQVAAEHVLGSRTAAAQARLLSSDQLSLADPYFSARYVENLRRVAPYDVLRVARKYLDGTHHVTAIVRPAVTASATQAAEAVAPRPTTTRIQFPENGMTLLVHRMAGQPAVSMAAAMKAGLSVETESTAGISAMVARYLERGTSSRSEHEIAEFFDGIGGSLESQSGWNSLYVQSVVLREHLAKAFEVFSDVVLNPAFSPDLLESTRERQRAALDATRSNPWGEGELYFRERFFNGSPYRFPETGTEQSIASLTLDDLRDFYARVRVGRNLVITVAGDVDPAEIERMVRSRFLKVPAGAAMEAPSGVGPRTIEQTEIYVRKSDKPGATVFVGYPGVDLFNLRDRAAMDVYEAICGGFTMRHWLHHVLRGQSLVYAVHFVGRAGLLPGYYRAQALCQPDKATRVARLMMDIVYSGRDYPFAEDDLRRAKAVLLTEHRFRRQTPDQVALMMTLDELYGLGYAFEERYLEMVIAVTADDLHRVVAAYVNKPVVCITTPLPDQVDADELRRPYDAGLLKEMRAATPEDVLEARPHTSPQ